MRHLVSGICIASLLILFALEPVTPAIGADEASAPALPETLYVVPFLNVMMPDGVSNPFFDAFIDRLMAEGGKGGMNVRILKQDIAAIDKAWLAQQHFVTGELYGYEQDDGCCSTEIGARARLYRYVPGSTEPADEISVSRDAFFDHDTSTLGKEQRVLADRLAEALSVDFMALFGPGR